MQTATVHSGSSRREPRRYYRVERRYSSPRPPRELVRDLLRAHSGT